MRKKGFSSNERMEYLINELYDIGIAGKLMLDAGLKAARRIDKFVIVK